MRNYTADAYEQLVEHIDDPTLQQFMSDEETFLAGIPDVGARTLVDLGAGYGRVEPFLSGIGQQVVAVEINTAMFTELSRRSQGLGNVTVIEGDFLATGILPEIENPIFLILQNSLGTIEGGDDERVVQALDNYLAGRAGELVMALLKQSALADWGTSMYAKLHDMIGTIDVERSDFEQGIFATDTGYTSKWWTDQDIDRFRSIDTVLREQATDAYQFLHLGIQ